MNMLSYGVKSIFNNVTYFPVIIDKYNFRTSIQLLMEFSPKEKNHKILSQVPETYLRLRITSFASSK